MRVYGAVGDRKPDYMDISNFPTSYYNPCRKDRWTVVYVVYDTTSSKSSLWEIMERYVILRAFYLETHYVELV